VKPIPVVFHLGPIQVHTYGIGLALTFWFAYTYFHRRLRSANLPDLWLSQGFLWIIGAAIVGARIVHVVANSSYYLAQPGQIPLIWHGGLSSYGGIVGGVVAGLYFLRKASPPVQPLVVFDIITPVLLAAWSMGRLLGPQLMYGGGGRPTNAWYGLAYAGESGRRIPVPIFQSIEDFLIYLVLLRVERYLRQRSAPPGLLLTIGLALWSIERFFDEFLWLAVPRLWDAVEVFALLLLVLSIAASALLVRSWRRTAKHELGDPETSSDESSHKTSHETHS
jgi:phosphatidylglycerol:prolipoprotein diacylglycerol transferase